MITTFKLQKTLRFNKSYPTQEPTVFNSIELIISDNSINTKIFYEFYSSLINSDIDENKELKLYTHPGSTITREMWANLKEKTKIKKTLNKENADIFTMSFKTFKKHILDTNNFNLSSKDFISTVSLYKNYKEFNKLLKNNFTDFDETKHELNAAKINNLYNDCCIYIEGLISASSYVDNICYTGWKSYRFYEFNTSPYDKLYERLCSSILEHSLHDTKSNQESKNLTLIFNDNSFAEINHIIYNKEKYVSEDDIKKKIQKDLSIIDKQIYKSLISMIKSNDTSNGFLAVNILSSVNVTESFGYITLIMYQCVNTFSNHREWFTSSNAKSFLTQYNTLCDNYMSKEFKENIWLGSSFTGCSLPKRIEEPKILMELIKSSRHNTNEILEIIKDIMLSDFKNFISRSWMHNIVNLEALCTSFDFKEDFKPQGVK